MHALRARLSLMKVRARGAEAASQTATVALYDDAPFRLTPHIHSLTDWTVSVRRREAAKVRNEATSDDKL